MEGRTEFWVQLRKGISNQYLIFGSVIFEVAITQALFIINHSLHVSNVREDEVEWARDCKI